MPKDPKDFPTFFKKYRDLYQPMSFAAESDFSAWGRKFEKFLDSIEGLDKEEQRKLIIDWQKQNPVPLPKQEEKTPKPSQDELNKFDFNFPNEYESQE